MPRRFVLSAVIGSGVYVFNGAYDPYRAKVSDFGVKNVCLIPSNPDGSPRFNWTLALVNATAADLATLDADPQIRVLPGFAALSDVLTGPQKTNISTLLTRFGQPTSIVTNATTFRDFLQALHDVLIPGPPIDVLDAP